MSAPVIRIDTPSGGWWEIQEYLTRGQRKELRRATSMGLVAQAAAAGVDLRDEDARAAYVAAHITEIDLDATDDAYLRLGVKAWSHPEPVTPEAIDGRDSREVDLVLAEMRTRYGEQTEEQRKN